MYQKSKCFLQSGASDRSLGFEDEDLGSSLGWWATTVATYCPSRPVGTTQILVFKTLRIIGRPEYVAQSRPVSPSPRKAKILKLNRRRYLANTSMCSPSRRRDLSIVYDVVRTPRRNVAETFSGSRNVIKCRLTPLLHCLTLRTLAFGWRGSRSVSLGHYLHRLNPLLIVLILSPPSISIPVQ